MNGIVINQDKDNVLVVTDYMKQGDKVHYKINDIKCSIILLEDIPIYHKVSMWDLKSGDKIIKYGEVIGIAKNPIAAGEHVHIHNMGTATRNR